ncbi:DUF924 family protein [Propylenella binzhouense]|uniref:DUF924 domain-containing protein n=1 Tax=Propylenella binzhouense TaxID=2555902 RepID=A0A964WUM4_9HYPH|nr:DUF924 family protein [Propylenella binzhouense]MYZ48995.1 DUF924 domain-containing protein [Propylenella binzhouense]
MSAAPIENPRPADLIAFWRAAGPEKWFAKDDAFDRAIRDGFEAARARALRGEFDAWRAHAEGALALILLLDQFSRNLYRGSPRAYEADPMALSIAREALQSGFDGQIEPALRLFFYLPFMHAENLRDQALCVALCYPLFDSNVLWFAREHERIIRRFGRFPHRNEVLGRHTTPAEQAYVEGGGFAG